MRVRETTALVLNEQELADAICMSVRTVRGWRMRGEGPRYVKLGGAVRYRPEDIAAWIKSRATGGTK